MRFVQAFSRVVMASSVLALVPAIATSQTSNSCPLYNAGSPTSTESVTR